MNYIIRSISILFILSLAFITASASSLEVAAIIDSITVNDSTCGLENGIITIHASGGANIRYSVNNGTTYQDGNVFTGLPNGDYLIVIISGTTCSDVSTVTLLQNSSPPPPEMNCPSLIVVDCLNDPLTSIDNQISNIPATNFNGEALQVSSSSPLTDLDVSLCNQPQPLELFSIDTCMGRTSCFVDIEFIDDNTPVINCPTELDVFIADPNHLDEIALWEMSITGDDPCGSAIDYMSDLDTTRINFLCDSFFMIPVVFTGIDECGNPATCNTQLNVTNELDPIVTCLPTFTIDCNADTEEVLDEILVQFEGDPAFDEDVSIAEGSNIYDIIGLLCGDTVTINFGVVDGCMRTTSCSTLFTIQDTISPTQDACPSDLIIEDITGTTEEDITRWLDNSPEAMDNCSMIDFSTDFEWTLLDDLCAWPDTITVQFIASDRCGNTTACKSKVFVAGNSVSLTCQDNLTIECGDADQAQLIDAWLQMATAMDQNGPLVIDNNFSGIPVAGSCIDSLEVLFTVNSSCGQPTCASKIYVKDTTAPEITCPDDETIFLSDGDVMGTIDLWLESIQGTDDCTAPLITSDFTTATFDVGCALDTMVIFAAIDSCGLSTTCSASISIINDLAVELLCPNDTTVLCASQDVNNFIESVIATAEVAMNTETTLTDNLQDLTLPVECNDTEVVTIEILAIDACSNTDVCYFDVTIRPDSRIYTPTTFSFSATEESNRSFQIFGDASVTITDFQVFDRWGNLVHNISNDTSPTNAISWDGRISGVLAEQGVYAYVLKYSDFNGDDTQLAGYFTLVR